MPARRCGSPRVLQMVAGGLDVIRTLKKILTLIYFILGMANPVSFFMFGIFDGQASDRD
jgi:hypothetical protein